VRGIQFEFGPGELEEYEDVPAALRQRLARTRTQYVLRTGAGRSDVAVQFQEALWLAISKVVDGIRLDPQDGTWT
jgi:hypothetical protein